MKVFLLSLLCSSCVFSQNLGKDTIRLRELIIHKNKEELIVFKNSKKHDTEWFFYYNTEIISKIDLDNKFKNKELIEVSFASIVKSNQSQNQFSLVKPIFKFAIYNNNREVVYTDTRYFYRDDIVSDISFMINNPISLDSEDFYVGIEFLGYLQDDKSIYTYNTDIFLIFFESRNPHTFSKNQKFNDGKWLLIDSGNEMFQLQSTIWPINFKNLNPCVKLKFKK